MSQRARRVMVWEENFCREGRGGDVSVLGFEVGVAGQHRGRKGMAVGETTKAQRRGILEE